VVGLGFVGASLAASLKAKGAPWTVRAADRRQSALSYALDQGLIDEAAESLEAGVVGADLVALTAPVGAIRVLLGTLCSTLQPGQVVTDVGSTKASIVAEARRALPPGVEFVGGHPVAGAERSGVERAEVGLFEGRTCVLTPDPDTGREALETVTALWRDLGCEVICMDPQTHDRVFALVSHLPHMVAYSLMDTVASELPTREVPIADGELREFKRVVDGPPALWRDVCLENREAIVRAIEGFSSRLDELRAAIDRGDAVFLDEFFGRARGVRGIPWTR
jgi:prephenate dehydrogenase